MSNSVTLSYIVLSLIIIVIDFSVAFLSLKDSKNTTKLSFAVLSINAGLVAFIYLISVLLENYTAFSIVTSVYFILIDTLLFCFLFFIFTYINKGKYPNNLIFKILYILIIVDSISLFINPVFEHAVSYVYRSEVAISHYSYSMKTFYNLHLILTYSMVVGIVGVLIRQTIKSNKEYKAVYYKPLLWVLLLVILNAVFLFRNGNTLFDLVDISIVGYSIILYTIYISFFSYGQLDVKEKLALKVLDKLDKYIFIFDENENIALKNELASVFTTSLNLSRVFTLQEFIEKSGIPIYKPYEEKKESFSSENILFDYDFQIFNEDGKVTGYLISLSRQGNIKDDLTDCYYPEYFNNIYRKSLLTRGKNIYITSFDIVSLGLINMMFSYRQGNEMILSLLDSIKTIFPENSIIIRSSRATLSVITFSLKGYELKNCILNVEKIFNGKLLSNSILIENNDADIEQYINKALSSINSFKEENNNHSKTINSMLTYYSKLDNNYLQIINRMSSIALQFAKELHISKEDMNKLETLVLTHEIGMIGLPSSLVLKSNPNAEETNILEEHTLRGYKISFSDSELREISDEILYHHENYDGSGYPYGIKGEEIPYLARILRIVYDFDYSINKLGYSIIDCLNMLSRKSNILYDPELIPIFIKTVNDNFDDFSKKYNQK